MLPIWTTGAGQPVLLLHSIGLDHRVWEQVVAQLTRTCRVVTVDLTGHGAAAGQTCLSIEGMADAVAATITESLGSPVTVAGLSMGGCIAQALTIRHPELVESMVLLDTTAWYGPDAVSRWRERAERAASGGFGALVDFQVQRWFTPTFTQQQPELVERFVEIFLGNDLAGYAAACEAMGSWDGRTRLGEVEVPTRIVVGKDDYATPPEHARELQVLVPGSVLTVLDDCAHLSAIEQPEACAREIEAVLGGARR